MSIESGLLGDGRRMMRITKGTKDVSRVMKETTEIWPGMTFWRWAHNSLLENGVYSDEDKYRNEYVPTLLKPGSTSTANTITDFIPSNVAVDSAPAFFHERWRAYFDKAPENENSWMLPSFEDKTGDFSVSLSDYSDGTATFSVSRLDTVDRRQVHYHDQGGPGSWLNYYDFEQSWPVATAKTAPIILLPGIYKFADTTTGFVHSYSRWGYQGLPGRAISRSFSFLKITELPKYFAWHSAYDIVRAGLLTDDPDDKGTFEILQPTAISITAEVGGSYGTGQATVTLTWKPYFKRSQPYFPGVRATQLRGRLNTKVDGSGREYRYVCNEKRVAIPGLPGEHSKNPTVCLDPETGEYVPIDVGIYDFTVGPGYNWKSLPSVSTSSVWPSGTRYLYNDNAPGFQYVFRTYETIEKDGETDNTFIQVTFRRKHVSVEKYWRNTAQRNFITEMRLYYIEGSPEYGGMIDPNTGEMVE